MHRIDTPGQTLSSIRGIVYDQLPFTFLFLPGKYLPKNARRGRSNDPLHCQCNEASKVASTGRAIKAHIPVLELCRFSLLKILHGLLAIHIFRMNEWSKRKHKQGKASIDRMDAGDITY